jgi:toxin-antitoxin system PIN domain toxin
VRALLDVNVLIALLDAAHTHHAVAHAWLRRDIAQGWASCPITQNGVVRIMSQPGYPQSVAPQRAARLLAGATATRHHEFWPDDISLLDDSRVDLQRVHGPRQLTDAYLLALAVHRGGRFVTFDAGIARSAVPKAKAQHVLVL